MGVCQNQAIPQVGAALPFHAHKAVERYILTLGIVFLTFTLHGGLSEDLTFPEVGAALHFHAHMAVHCIKS